MGYGFCFIDFPLSDRMFSGHVLTGCHWLMVATIWTRPLPANISGCFLKVDNNVSYVSHAQSEENEKLVAFLSSCEDLAPSKHFICTCSALVWDFPIHKYWQCSADKAQDIVHLTSTCIYINLFHRFSTKYQEENWHTAWLTSKKPILEQAYLLGGQNIHHLMLKQYIISVLPFAFFTHRYVWLIRWEAKPSFPQRHEQ